MKNNYQLFLCQILNPLSDTKCVWIKQGALLLKKNHHGDFLVHKLGQRDDILKRYGSKCSNIHEHSRDLLMPGLFDMHFHWVQDDVRSMPKRSLLQWLAEYTWPYEYKFKDKGFSRARAKRFADELLSVGTLGGACYASVHGHTVGHALREFIGSYIVGNVLMTMNSPAYLTQTKSQALRLVASLAKKYTTRYAVTPRFAPSTHPEVMREAAKMGRQNGSFIQSHLSETEEEVDYVLGLFRQMDGLHKVKTYTEVYQKCGLLGKKTIMGHGIYLQESEWDLLAKTQTAIAHCPTSNAPHNEGGLASGLFDFNKADRKNVRWALGTDIGAGPNLSMLDVMRSFVRQNRRHKVLGATYVRALYRGTLKGAEILNKGKTQGNLALGKEANFIVLKSPRLNGAETAETVLAKLLDRKSLSRRKLDGLVKKTIYRGREVYRRG